MNHFDSPFFLSFIEYYEVKDNKIFKYDSLCAKLKNTHFAFTAGSSYIKKAKTIGYGKGKYLHGIYLHQNNIYY